MNIEERVQEIIRPYITQPSINMNNGVNTNSTYNTLRDSRTSYDNIMYSIVLLYPELKVNTELFNAVSEEVQKQMQSNTPVVNTKSI